MVTCQMKKHAVFFDIQAEANDLDFVSGKFDFFNSIDLEIFDFME